MNWAWRQALTPTLKLILMALADAADDQGVCWPSVSTLAKKCTVSTRTVQRSLRVLIHSGLLIAETRQRRDGSSTSNRYRLLMRGGDNLSLPCETGDIRPGQGCRGDPDMPVIPGTTNRIIIDPPQPAARDEQPMDSATVQGGRGCLLKLEYPKGLSPSEHADAQRRLARLPARIGPAAPRRAGGASEGRHDSDLTTRHLAGVIRHANACEFVAGAALRVADERERRHRNEAHLQKLHALNDASQLQETVIEDSRIARRLAGIRLRSRGRDKGG